MPFVGLSENLMREQELMELLLYRLEVERMLLAANRTAHLHRAAAEVEEALLSLQEAELGRAIETSTLAAELGLAPEATLRDIAASAPAPWDTVLADQRTELARLTAEIRTVTEGHRAPGADPTGGTGPAIHETDRGR